jgi:hypothetical protein
MLMITKAREVSNKPDSPVSPPPCQDSAEPEPIGGQCMDEEEENSLPASKHLAPLGRGPPLCTRCHPWMDKETGELRLRSFGPHSAACLRRRPTGWKSVYTTPIARPTPASPMPPPDSPAPWVPKLVQALNERKTVENNKPEPRPGTPYPAWGDWHLDSYIRGRNRGHVSRWRSTSLSKAPRPDSPRRISTNSSVGSLYSYDPSCWSTSREPPSSEAEETNSDTYSCSRSNSESP